MSDSSIHTYSGLISNLSVLNQSSGGLINIMSDSNILTVDLLAPRIVSNIPPVE